MFTDRDRIGLTEPLRSLKMQVPGGIRMVSRRFLQQAACRLRAAVPRPWVAVLFSVLAGSTQAQVVAPAPRLSPLPGAYPGPIGVTLSADVANAEIHFTVDGTAPTLASPTYTSPIAVEGNATIRAVAVAPGYSDSPETQGTYTTAPATRDGIAAEFTRTWTTTDSVQTLEFSTTASDVLLLAFVSSAGTPGTSESVSLTSSDLTWRQGSSAECQPTFAGYWVATAPVPLTLASTRVARAASGSPLTITVVALVGARRYSARDTVLCWSNYAPALSFDNVPQGAWHYAVASAVTATGPLTLVAGQTLVSETIEAASGTVLWVQQSGTAPAQDGGSVKLGVTSPTSTMVNLAATEVLPAALLPPAFKPAAGTYDSSVTVTLSARPPARIRYTTDGTTPTTGSTLYSGPLTISRTTTVKAIAEDRYSTPPVTAVASATYTITPPLVSLAVQAPSTSLSAAAPCSAPQLEPTVTAPPATSRAR